MPTTNEHHTNSPAHDAKALVPLGSSPHRRREAEQTRRLPPPVAKAFAAAGLLQLYLPKSMGGPEQPPPIAFDVIETISKADGSAGWCLMVANGMAAFMGWLTPGVGRHFAGHPADFRAAGSLRPLGRAARVEGGYRVQGRWNFASGIDHATWLYCSAVVTDGEKPVLTAAGGPLIRAMWVPAPSARIIDTWSVVGMRGTGSQDFVVDDVFVRPRGIPVRSTERRRSEPALFTTPG